MSPESALITTSAVARRFAVDPATVRRWVETGKLRPAVTTPGGHFRFDPDEVDAIARGPRRTGEADR